MKHSAKMRSARGMTRREFVGRTLMTAGVIAGAPAILRGQNLNNKLNIAFIGSGGRANASLAELTIVPGAAAARGRRPNAEIPGVPHPDENVTVLCDVNQDALDSASARYPKAKKVTDLRRVFDHPNDFDAVVVSTAEHTHAFATYLALTHGKHVYCEKPLAYNIWETRLIRETAAKFPKLSTQMGNQGHASEARRSIREILETGVIGPVHEVHVWADRAWGLQDAASAEKFDKPHGFYNGIQVVDRFKEEMPVPANLAWDLWLGPAPVRPYHATYFPGPRWYRWWDFANGTMSDLGSHDNDVPYTVLDLWRPDGQGRRKGARAAVGGIDVAQRAGGAQGAGAGDDAGDVPVRGGRCAAGAEAGVAPGGQQTAGLGAGVGRPVVRLHRREGDAAGERQAVAGGEIQGLQEAGGEAAAVAGALGRVGELREGERAGAGVELPVLRMDDGGESPGQRRLPHGKKDRVGLRGDAGHQRARGGSVHQAAGVPERVGGDTEGLVL